MKPKSSKPREVARVAGQNGFVFDHQTGAHAVFYRSFDRRRLVIPMHNKDVKMGLLRKLIVEMGLTVEQYNEQV
jgi:predicted RNA binding protein YcfA (HicA-like mRNA interferase family)